LVATNDSPTNHGRVHIWGVPGCILVDRGRMKLKSAIRRVEKRIAALNWSSTKRPDYRCDVTEARIKELDWALKLLRRCE